MEATADVNNLKDEFLDIAIFKDIKEDTMGVSDKEKNEEFE